MCKFPPGYVLEYEAHRKRHEIAAKISRDKYVFNSARCGVFVIAVIIPTRSGCPVVGKLIVQSAKRMEPKGIERASYLVGDERLGIEPQLRAGGTGQIGA